VNVPTLRLRPIALAAFTAVVVLALQAAPALADTATFEQPAGPAASAIDHVYRAVLGVTVTIFVLVGGWLLYSALRFRVRRGESNIEPPQVRGSTRLEIGWTLAPVLVLAALAGYTLDNIPAVKLEVKSKDVDHDWWVPALGPKIDAIPGQTNSTWFKATRTGTFKGQCAEFCGLGHATMLITVKVVTPAEWSTYTAKLQKT
jgi:cytochrome c oxidase subunit 2